MQTEKENFEHPPLVQSMTRFELFEAWGVLYEMREAADGEERAEIDQDMWAIETEIGRRAQ